MTNKIVKGTMLLTGAAFLSKFLGLIYVIPFNAMVGTTGGTLYGFAYTPYSIFLSLSTVGIPAAVSKFVSKYNTLEDYQTGMRMFKVGSLLMLITGFTSFLVLFFGADIFAQWSISSENAKDVTQEDAAFAIKMVSFALIIIPSMSIVRGYFQGNESMGPTALSQIIEQIVRIAVILVGTYIILNWLGGTIVTAVGFSTFAAFIGAVASCIVLGVYWIKRKPYIQRQLDSQEKPSSSISTKTLLAELLSYAGPFVIVGLAIPLYQIVDQFTFERAMTASGRADIWSIAYAGVNVYGHKIVIIPMTIAIGLSLSMLPTLTKSFTQNDQQAMKKQINQALQIVMVFVIPACVGMIVLSSELYGSFYGLETLDITGSLLAWYAPVALLFALFTVTSSILQGINQQNYAVLSLLVGLLVKVLLNIQLIHTFGAKGAIFGTALASGIAVVLNLYRIKKSIRFEFKQTIKRTILVGIFTVIMVLIIYLLKMIMGWIMPYEESRMGVTIMLLVGVAGGGVAYLVLAYISTLLEHVFGGKIPVVDRLLRRRG